MTRPKRHSIFTRCRCRRHRWTTNYRRRRRCCWTKPTETKQLRTKFIFVELGMPPHPTPQSLLHLARHTHSNQCFFLQFVRTATERRQSAVVELSIDVVHAVHRSKLCRFSDECQGVQSECSVCVWSFMASFVILVRNKIRISGLGLVYGVRHATASSNENHKLLYDSRQRVRTH